MKFYLLICAFLINTAFAESTAKVVLIGSGNSNGPSIANFQWVIVDGVQLPNNQSGEYYTVPYNAKLVITDMHITPRDGSATTGTATKSFDVRYLPAPAGSAFGISAIYTYNTAEFHQSLTTGFVVSGGKKPFVYCSDCAKYNAFNVTLNGYYEIKEINLPNPAPRPITIPTRPNP